jgi:Integrase core domain
VPTAHPQIERSSHRPSSGSQWASPGSRETGRPVAGDRWHSLPRPCDRLVGGTSKRNHRVGSPATAPSVSVQNDIWVERFQQTLKRWLVCQPPARDLAALQAQLDTFRSRYNEQRPHRAIGRRTPAAAYAAQPKAHPAGRGAPGHFRLRYDTTDKKGAITLRRGGRMHHLRIGAIHAGTRVLAIVDEHEVTVVALDTGELLSVHRIEADKGYWRNTRRDPGRWPGSQATD